MITVITIVIGLTVLGALIYEVPRRRAARATKRPIKDTPPKSTFEPTCLAKGVAKAWTDDSGGWTITRKKVTVPYYSSGGSSLTQTHTYYQVQLRYPRLGIRIQGSEAYHSFQGVSVYIEEELKVFETYSSDSDSWWLGRVITTNPYPILKRDIDKHTAQVAREAAQTKAIVALGCPS